ALTLTSSHKPSNLNHGVTTTETATATPPGTVPGTATFVEGSTTLGTGTITAGVATFQTSALAGGAHSITASYGGSANFAPSTSAPLSQTVNAAVSSLGLSAQASAIGGTSFNVTVTARDPSSNTV